MKPVPKDIKKYKSVTLKIYERLMFKNLDSAEKISILEPLVLSREIEIPENKALKIITEAKENIFCYFESGLKLLDRQNKSNRLKTKIDSFDAVTKGLETQSIIEFYGAFGSGKTQMVHQLSVVSQFPISEGGLNSSVVIIDTENTFRMSRVKDICERFDKDFNKICKNIYIVKPKNSDEQILIMEKLLHEDINEFIGYTLKKPLKVIIIDSLVSRFRSEYIGRGLLASRQQKLNKHLNDALNFSIKTNGIIIITNQVTESPDMYSIGPKIKPVGGNVVGHSATYRFYLKKASRSKRIIKIIDSPDLPNEEVLFSIGKSGLYSDSE